MEKGSDVRKANHEINKLFLDRWSPRAFSGEEIYDEELFRLFEAARWAPSSYNGQPWKYIYAKRNTPEWEPLFNLLVEGNQGWAKNASVLLVVASANNFEHSGNPSVTHTFDTGSSWMNLALQATDMGLAVHGMEGFDYKKAKEVLNIPEDHTVEAMIAIGKQASAESLPEGLQKMEHPSDRKKIEEFIFKGKLS